mmetsp:Transcript_19778/g.36450  ORF Transcript_19778/g.36450 Transcript_19778/m.36450 type:complete len:182 (-) Transcript_19778:6649-7194(-)
MELYEVGPFVLNFRGFRIDGISVVTLENYKTVLGVDICTSIPSQPLSHYNTPVRQAKLASLPESALTLSICQLMESIKIQQSCRTEYRTGDDLCVRRPDGFIKVYANTSACYQKKKKDRYAHQVRCAQLKEEYPNYTPKPRPLSQTLSKSYSSNEKEESPRQSLQDITNTVNRRLEFGDVK